MRRRGKIHYAWVILLGCSSISLVSLGLLGVCRSNFLAPVVEELGCKVSEYTLYTSIGTATAALFYPVSARFLKTRHIGKFIAMGEALQLTAIGMMSVYRSITPFYFSGFMYGVGSAFTTFMAVPILINMWFTKKAGLALGIAMSFRGIGSALFSPLVAMTIEALGWRQAYVAVALTGAVLGIPMAFFFLRRPREMGMEPYGGENGAVVSEISEDRSGQWGLTRRESFRTPALYLAWLPGMIFSITAIYSSYLPSFSTMELGNPMVVGATALSIASVASIVCNLVLGPVNDRFGLKAGLLWGCGFMVLGLVCLLISIGSPVFLYGGALFFGLGGGMYLVQTPLLVRGVIGSKYYADVWPYIMTVNSLSGAVSYPLLVSIYDRTGSYQAMFRLGIALLILAYAVGCASISLAERQKQHKSGGAYV